MNKFIKLFLILTTLLIIFVSCSGESTTPTDNPTTDNPTIKSQSISKKLKLNISDATNLYIGKSTSSSRSARVASNDTEKKLFKITEDGYVQEIIYSYEVTTVTEYEIPYEVEIFDEEGNVIGTTTETKIETKTEVTTETATETFTPSSFFNINNNYLFVCFKSDSYLVRKTDGSAFSVPKEIGLPDKNGFDFLNANPIRFDDNNNIYYLYDHKIIKINLNGIENLTSNVASASSDYVYHFEVDKNGNLVYSGASDPSTYSPINRVRKANGGIANISYMGGNWCFDGWLAPDGFIYCIKYDNSNMDYKINKIDINDNFEFSEIKYGHIDSSPYCVTTEYSVNLKNVGIIVDTNPCKIFEVYNSNKTPRVVNLNNLVFNTISAVSSTENFYYIAGTDTNNNSFLIKINPENDQYTNLLNKNEYDVLSFTASETEGIIFNALRMSDGKKIIGKVGIDGGTITTIDEEIDSEIYYLQKIN